MPEFSLEVMYQWNVQKRREAWKLLGIIPKELAGLSGCQNATSAIQFPRWTARNDSWIPHQRITGTSANALLSLSRTLTFGEWPWYLGMAAMGRCCSQQSHRDATGEHFLASSPGYLSVSASKASSAAHHTRTSRCSTAGTRAVSRTWRSPTTRPPGSRRHFRWWTSYTWCSLVASSEWAALCGHRPGRKGVSRTASVTWKPSSPSSGKKCGRRRGAFFPFICIY